MFVVYIMTNASRRPFYTGVTGRVEGRAGDHKLNLNNGYTARYNLTRMVYYELHADPYAAIAREKEIKGWSRAKKIALIESVNPRWDDLARDWDKRWRPETPRSFTTVSRAGESAREPSAAQDDPTRVGDDKN
jgi:putative endonuclease